MKELELKNLVDIKTAGSYGLVEVKILVGATFDIDIDSTNLVDIGYEAAQKLMDSIQSTRLANNEEEQLNVKRERFNLLSLFDDKIFVREIPNGYADAWFTKHKPWYLVTTKIGTFKIGWRKSVIHLEWTDTAGTKSAGELFKEEDVTKDVKMIHAWSLDKAREYIAKIMSTADRSCLITV